MASEIYEEFCLKGDSTTASSQNKPPKGRLYTHQHAQQPGGIRVDELIYGIQMAHLSCTDDTDDRLKGSGANTLKALEAIVQPENTSKPLSTLLKDHFGLTLDCWIDESGIRNGRAVDTQGFIASNDDTIVLSFRFSTSGLDWITNLSMTSSEWEPDKDELIGHAGFCSCFDGLFTKYVKGKGKPRVHTGFYNNFLYTIPMIRKHILEPLLASNAKPKKVFICGCSLGAAIASLAFCFILEELMPTLENPNAVGHKLINVTAGCPRVGDTVMKAHIMDKMKRLRPLDRAVIARLVYCQDLVPHIPLTIAGFHHMEKLVYITRDGKVIINPTLEKSKNFTEVKAVCQSFWSKEKSKNEVTVDTEGKTPFEVECEKTPVPIKDHMPYWYLTSLVDWKQHIEASLIGDN